MTVPAEIVQALGSGKKPRVAVTINIAAGYEIDVELELDTAPRVVDVPPDLAAALDAEPSARQQFETLSSPTNASTCSRSKARRPRRPGSGGWPRPSRHCSQTARADRVRRSVPPVSGMRA
ncbi:YdeI/OmpD-associated family protein [Micromonospora cremea]|uniref:YdeI/OmpD-associated family protein n=1 Tax=Micromonospora cremea TaxID=709881 RepID=UPI003CC7EC30